MDIHLVYTILLWFCLILFILRVLGQIYVARYKVPWLPPMKEWYSGLMPYHLLLPSQIIIIIVMSLIAYDFTRADGFFFITNDSTATTVTIFSVIYFSSMILRYIITMFRYPERRWLGGCIPIIFHCVLALFIFLCGTYNRFH